MKLFTNLFILTSLFTVACGPTKNDPLENYKHLNLSKEAQSAPQKVDYKLVTQIKEVPVTETKYIKEEIKVPVVQEKAVYLVNCPSDLLKESEGNYRQCLENLKTTAEQISIDGPVYEVKSYSDAGLQKEEALIFTEGQESTYYLETKVLYRSKVNFSINIEDQPTNADISEVSKKENSVVYKITWKPQDVLKNGSTEEKALFKVTLTDLEFTDANAKNNEVMRVTFEAISKITEKEITVIKKEDAKVSTQPSTTKTTTVADPDKNSGRR